MSAICALIVTFSTLCGSRVVSGVLSAPKNVSLTSFNMNMVLRWNSPESEVSGLVYTTEYNTSFSDYRPGCVNISSYECDFTNLSTNINEYATYTGRVRAQLGAETSAWVESNQITLDKDTIIGSPTVFLLSNGVTIEASIKDPEFTFSALRKVYTTVIYNVTYWKKGQEEKTRSITQQNRVVLNDLDVWTIYCVQVQIRTDKIPSKPSKTVCKSTSNKEEAPWVPAVVTFVVMAMSVTLVVVAVVYRKSISHFLCPKDALPQHFKEYLQTPPNSSMYLAMRNSHPPEEIYHHISIVTDDITVGGVCPLEAAETSSTKQPDIMVEER